MPAGRKGDDLPERVGRALEPLDEVRVAYVFGSRAGGRARADSDLDVAVRLDPALDDLERGRAKLRIVAALTDALGAMGERTDVVDLDRASSSVAFRAIRDGRRVLEREARERVRLEAWIARRYDDDAPKRAIFRRAARAAAERMAGG